MKIAILHHDLEWTEQEIEKIVHEKQLGEIKKFDIRDVSIKNIKEFNPDLILNRIYASVANRDYDSIKKSLQLLEILERNGFNTINSLETSKGDYSKFYAFEMMKKNKVNTPKTIIFEEELDLEKAIKDLEGFPIIVKRDTGGRGKDLKKCLTQGEIREAVKEIKKQKNYQGHTILQEFIEPIKNHDYRVWVINGEVVFYHKRSLISVKKDEKPWLASRSLGSEIQTSENDLSEELINISKKASESIKAKFNVLDIMESKKGFHIIEHNPTPNLRPEYEKILGFNPAEFLIKKLIKGIKEKNPLPK